MKTPRELLLDRHRSAESKLDAIREEAVASLRVAPASKSSCSMPAWRELVLSMRWHLAGLGAAWLLVALLNIDHSSASAQPMAAKRPEPARQFLTAVQENRRQISKLIEPMGDLEPADPTQPMIPQRRSEAQSTTAFA